MTVEAIQFPTKQCLFQPPRSKTVIEDAFSVDKVQFFRGGGTRHNLTILTMCKIPTYTRIKLQICNVYIITFMK